jgi:UDPglucose 6-dehydrogenase/GDP-mannose 6-dehydrogenase
MKVSIVGAGYVGLVSGACFADDGHIVTCIDSNIERVDQIESGKAPFFEPGLDAVLKRVVGKQLFATSDFNAAVRDSELTLIAVGTPSFPDGSVDLSAIKVVSELLGKVLRDKDDFHVVVVKSTVPAGTTDNVVGKILEKHSGKQRGKHFGLGMNPEFLTEGTAVSDFRSPDRIVIGGTDEKTLAAQRELYRAYQDTPLLEVNNTTAEMIKYMSNALLATMISFANEFADLCTAIGGVDSADVQRGVHLSRYLTAPRDTQSRTAGIASFVEAGCGFGGSCLPKDVKGLVSLGAQSGVPMRMMESVLGINEDRANRLIDVLRKGLANLRGRRIAVLGLSFRPDTNDMRESPAIAVIDRLAGEGCSIKAFDPQSIDEAKAAISTPDVDYSDSLLACVADVDAVVIITRWSEFLELPKILASTGQSPLVVDGRRMLQKDAVANYLGIGA